MPEEQLHYVTFLRGINVGGHHKVPMSELKEILQKLGCLNVITFLNSGNAMFSHASSDADELEDMIGTELENTFNFSIPTVVMPLDEIRELWASDPFRDIQMTKDKRCYISLARQTIENKFPVPWESEDSSFRILAITPRAIISILDLSKNKTPAAMKILEDTFGKDITTRNWNTIDRILKKAGNN